MSKIANVNWLEAGKENGWQMPYAPRWKRLPVIRHIRAIRDRVLIERWYSTGLGSLGIRTGYDDWVVYGIWSGQERAQP